jgi:predicted signal transduction protein with EAL and GGDEF domain
MSDLAAQNRQLLAQIVTLRQELSRERDSNYRESWVAIASALDQVAPDWLNAGPTAVIAACVTIRMMVPGPQVGWLAVRNSDTQFVQSAVGARSYEKQGYTLLALTAHDPG